MVRTLTPPEDLVALGDLDRVDYREGFRLEVPERRDLPATSEDWARATLEQAHPALRRVMLLGWPRLGLGLGPRPSPDHVLGWRVLVRDPDLHVQGVRSGRRFGTVRIVLRQRHEGDVRVVEWVMAIRFHGEVGRFVWAVLGPAHRVFVRRLLRDVGARR